ncbi:MAG TPA: hypothetical protein PKW44_05660 [Methylophilaceae bacterium]|nr:hypothetical protein [Methylophilaceae bacterium]HQR60791.1 hypothetical protein [Methylophilaceae bacterium]
MRIIFLLVLAMLAGCASMTKSHSDRTDHKVPVCHKGKTLYVDKAAVDAHIKHGDYGRACYGEKKQGDDQKD